MHICSQPIHEPTDSAEEVHQLLKPTGDHTVAPPHTTPYFTVAGRRHAPCGHDRPSIARSLRLLVPGAADAGGVGASLSFGFGVAGGSESKSKSSLGWVENRGEIHRLE